MVVIFILVFIIFAISLYEYQDNAEWKELSYSVSNKLFRNKKYGGYAIRNAQSWILVVILLVTLAFAGGAIFLKRGLNMGSAPILDMVKEVSDTVQFTLNDPETEVATPPSKFNFDGNNGDNLPQAVDGGDKGSDDEDDPSTTSNKTPSNSSDNSSSKSKNNNPEQSIYDFEKEQFKNAGGAAERERIQKEMEQRKRDREAKNKQKQGQTGGNGGVAGTKGSSNEGETMVSWDLDGRNAHQKNDWYVRNPGYTCGKGINAKVVIKVRVNSNGDVITVTSQAPPGTNECCIEQAKKYAKMSRFEFSDKQWQEGTITYNFKSQ